MTIAVALADKESLREGKLRSLRQALDLYRARLGLHFRRGLFPMATELLCVLYIHHHSALNSPSDNNFKSSPESQK